MEVAEGREPSGFSPGGLRRTAKSFGLAKIRVMQLEAAVGQVPPGDGSWPVNAGLAKAFR
jgi:Rod binding domain-containing protein